MTLNTWKWTVPLAVVGLVGCGEGVGTRVYDVELDAAALSDVPVECTGDLPQLPRGWATIEARQRWTLRDAEYSATTLEVPDVDFLIPAARLTIDEDDAPDILQGSSSEAKVLNFLDLRTEDSEGALTLAPQQRLLRYRIERDESDDAIKGIIWVRGGYVTTDGVSRVWVGECTSTLPFTGRRVEQ